MDIDILCFFKERIVLQNFEDIIFLKFSFRVELWLFVYLYLKILFLSVKEMIM